MSESPGPSILSDRESTLKAEKHAEIIAGNFTDPPRSEDYVFKYTELDPHSNQIRLLCLLPKRGDSGNIKCELIHVSLDDSLIYKALSYMWGSGTDLRHTISLQGYPFEVRNNLWEALMCLRNEDTELVLWIDAICINQSSDVERGHQVAMMKMIYEQAVEVAVWLGPGIVPGWHLAFPFVQDIYFHREAEEWVTQRLLEPDRTDMLENLAAILKGDYWQRIWIVQELLLAKKIMLHCGHTSIDGQHLLAVQKLFSHNKKFKAKVLDAFEHDERWHTPILQGGMVAFELMKQYLRSGNPSFYTCLLHNYKRLSSDPRDMIYGLAALVNETTYNRVKVDYSLSPRELFIKFARQEIETSRRLDIITRVFPGLSAHKLPSWVPDWTGIDFHRHVFQYDISQGEFQRCSASNREAATTFYEESLHAKGVKIGKIECCAIEYMVSLTFLESCVVAVRDCWELIVSMENVSLPEHETFARTLVFDKISDLDLGDRTKSELLRGILGWLGVLFAGSVNPRNYPVLLEYWNGFITSGKNMSDGERVEQEALYKPMMLSWMRVIFQNIWDRQFFIMSPKIMGLAAKEVTVDDILFIPLGCCHPVVLRKLDNHYVNLGEAYVDGFMTGNAMNMLERGELKLEEFAIH